MASPFAKENADEIAELNATVELLQARVKKMTEGPYVSKILLSTEIYQAKMDLSAAKATKDKISIDAAQKRLDDLIAESEKNKRIMAEQRYTRQAMRKTAKECDDGRQSVPVVAQHMLMLCIEQYNVAGGAEMYQTKVKEITLTPKQATKYRHGEVRGLHPLYDPKNRNEAIMDGFYGVQCSCGSWRVKIDKEGDPTFKLHCFACLATFNPITLSLPKTSGVVIDSAHSTGSYEQWKKNNNVA